MGNRVTPIQWLVHGSLFCTTFLTCIVAGVQWLNKDPFELGNLPLGLPYALLITAFLLSHELGHYVAARKHGLAVTLPYFLPFPSFLGLAPFGTLGAVIRLKAPVPSRKVLFDVGAAGPICGLVLSLIMLGVGFLTLPGWDYLVSIHPEYARLGTAPNGGLTFGESILYIGLQSTLSAKGAFVPPMNEIYHYPMLCVGWFGLFVTTLNLLPVGQLDGGHIASSIAPRQFRKIQLSTIIVLLALGIGALMPLFGMSGAYGWSGWLFWATLLYFLFLKQKKQSAVPLSSHEKISPGRLCLGILCMILLLLSFSPVPIHV